MYEFILESTRLVFDETTTGLSTIYTEMTKQVHFGGIVDPDGVGLRQVMLNDKHTEANSIQNNYLHFLNFVLVISSLPQI